MKRITGGIVGVAVAVLAAGVIAGPPLARTAAASDCPTFRDVPASHQFAASICWLAAAGVTKGTGDGTTYSPAAPVTRGSMAAFLYRLSGSPSWTPPAVSPFADVAPSNQFYHSITWLAHEGITKGVTIGGKLYYQPGNAVNRGSMAAFLRRLSGSPPYTPAGNPFADLTRANQFHDSILWLASQKITVGTTVDGRLVYQSGNPVNRGSMAAFMARMGRAHTYCQARPDGVDCPTRTKRTPTLTYETPTPCKIDIHISDPDRLGWTLTIRNGDMVEVRNGVGNRETGYDWGSWLGYKCVPYSTAKLTGPRATTPDGKRAPCYTSLGYREYSHITPGAPGGAYYYHIDDPDKVGWTMTVTIPESDIPITASHTGSMQSSGYGWPAATGSAPTVTGMKPC